MDKQLIEIREKLKFMAERESTRLFRLARRAASHGCSQKLVNEIKEEAIWLNTNGTSYPDRLVAWNFQYDKKYAFR